MPCWLRPRLQRYSGDRALRVGSFMDSFVKVISIAYRTFDEFHIRIIHWICSDRGLWFEASTPKQQIFSSRPAFGVTRGRAPILDVDPCYHVMCCLHLNLSIVGTLWKHGVLYHLSGPKKRERADRVNLRLKELGIHVWDTFKNERLDFVEMRSDDIVYYLMMQTSSCSMGQRNWWCSS